MSGHCPCCGQPVRSDMMADLCASVTPTMARILRAIARRPGITAAELADVVYGDRPDGGPDDATNVITSVICQQRQRVVAAGWRILSQGGSRSGYRLERVA